jgi:hypothetical protein
VKIGSDPAGVAPTGACETRLTSYDVETFDAAMGPGPAVRKTLRLRWRAWGMENNGDWRLLGTGDGERHFAEGTSGRNLGVDI